MWAVMAKCASSTKTMQLAVVTDFPAAPAACRGIQWGTVAGYAQCAPGQHLRHQEIVFQACRFALIPDRGGIDILLSRLGKDYGPLQGKLRSMRFLTASQGWAFCASCS